MIRLEIRILVGLVLVNKTVGKVLKFVPPLTAPKSSRTAKFWHCQMEEQSLNADSLLVWWSPKQALVFEETEAAYFCILQSCLKGTVTLINQSLQRLTDCQRCINCF